MSGSWRKRKTRLNNLLTDDGDEDAKALALDRILHGQSVIGRTARTAQIEELRFGDQDLGVLGTLEFGQYGVIDVVTCKLNGKSYIRKSVEKKFAMKTRDQCSPQTERDILLRALKSETRWAPHLLCAFQTSTHLNVVMDYAEGGTLWDVMESSPHDGRISESDVAWWTPQIVSAIHWCHSQGYVHRDIKPHNIVITASGHIQLIDFGSAAPLLLSEEDGSQLVPKRYCLVPCGTCDYISPEILQCHEEALVALEMSDDTENVASISEHEPGGYGRETDWWSFGAMLYEMVYGVAPFFANDIRQTYMKIMDHRRSLRFSSKIPVSAELRDLISRLLNSAELRLGRGTVDEIMTHSFFLDMKWDELHQRPKPDELHLPKFTYADPLPGGETVGDDSRAFAFSAFFQSSPLSAAAGSLLQGTPGRPQQGNKSILRDSSVTSFIGFSWGPAIDAFDGAQSHLSPPPQITQTPRPTRQQSTPLTSKFTNIAATPQRFPQTPLRPSGMTPFRSLPRPSTVQRTAQRRAVSDREALKQLVSCVGASARKKVLASGRKPRVLAAPGSSRTSTLKELRFDRSVMVVGADSGVSFRTDAPTASESGVHTLSFALSASAGSAASLPASLLVPEDTDESESEAPPSPSPSPRPGSAMSMWSKRSQTPTATSFNAVQVGHRNAPSMDSKGPPSAPLVVDPAWPAPKTRPAQRTAQRPPSPTPLVDLVPPSRRTEEPSRAAVANETLPYDALDDLQQRHDRLMQDILGITGRLENVSRGISSRS
ncbi:kinase-like protein [Phanerochaete sordida]|uniref:non-specific serine/threonine protein kinase n=1 Tax=Phanerochaete sordida TaxID=48140 RepID=A0A9P3LDU4_9APHY|nr:kinase-like protein [Phanerochaete sordida]